MWSRRAEMRRHRHRVQGRFDRMLWIGKEGGDSSQRLVWLGVEDMQNDAHQQGVAGLFPMVSPFERPFRVNQHVGDVLHVADFPRSTPNLQQRIIGGRRLVGRIEKHHAAMPFAKAGGQRPVLAFDIVDNR